MEFLIEGVLELLFSLVKRKPEKRPELELKNEFTVCYNKASSIVILSILFLVSALFFVLSFFVDRDTKVMFYIFSSISLLTFFLFLFLFSITCRVNSVRIQKITLFFFKREIMWSDIICVRAIEKDDEKNILIALYAKDKKCVLDVTTDMKNAWYIVKMAESKNIEVREEKDLTLKQISRL